MDLSGMQQYITERGITEQDFEEVLTELKGYNQVQMADVGKKAITMVGTQGIIEYGNLVGKPVPPLPDDTDLDEETLYKAIMRCIGHEVLGETDKIPDFPFVDYALTVVSVYVLFERIKVTMEIEELTK